MLNQKGDPIPNQNLSLISKMGEGLFVSDTTDATGRFLFHLPAYPDSTQFILQTANTKKQTDAPRIVLDKFPYPHFRTPSLLKQSISLSVAHKSAYIRQYADTTLAVNKGWLKPVNLSTRKPFQDPRRMSTLSTVLTTDELMKLGMGNVGLGILRMPGVQLINGFLRFYGPDQFSGANSSSEPTVFMDGNQLSLSSDAGGTSSSPVIQYLNSLNPREIDFIEVLKGAEASVFGIRGGEGVIAIHSSNKIHQDFVSKEGNVFRFSRQGYAKPTTFLLVTYDKKNKNDLSVADTRSVLYWNENELLNKEGRAMFNFYTNDVPSQYKVVITGITVHGDLIHQTLSFTNK